LDALLYAFVKIPFRNEFFPMGFLAAWVFGCLVLKGRASMGTVGLSFGSPTSGAGFDVSSTVSAIVANLQNGETPWKTQLASLESQDTAISSLGTLFSNLSNDMSSLTDLQGILSEKTGSSSDTNVLSLTAANSSALAGTYTVAVTNLAQTSSGYLAPIASASDRLAGSITLQVGSGTAQTITLGPSDNTLAGLAAAINSSSAGITASVLTDASGSRLSLVSGTSGANGNISVSANSIVDSSNTTTINPAYTTSSSTTGNLTPIANAGSDALAGSVSITVAGGAAQVISVPTTAGNNNLAGLEGAINAANIGVTASIVTNSDGSSSLALNSGTNGTLAVAPSIADTTNSLAYRSPVAGINANMTVDGVNLTSASNTVANLIPGVTFQLLAPSTSGEQVQVVIGNDNTGVESTVNQFVTDYNSLVSAMNTQDGNTASGTPEPLFGSPTLSLLQQQLLGGLNTSNPNGSLAAVANVAGTTFSGSMTIGVGSGTTENVVFGAAPASPAANTIYTGSGINTLAGLASAINSAGIGATANVVTSGGDSTLTLTSQTAGSSGALSVGSNIVATAPTALFYSDSGGYTPTTADSGTLGKAALSSDTLSGSVSISIGAGSATSFTLDSSDNTLAGLSNTINTANIGVTAAVVTNLDGTSSLSLTSATVGAAGVIHVSSSLLDPTSPTNTTLNYSNSSDINNLTSLGISVNNDGSIAFDAEALDSTLNTDYGSVVGFFQNANGWGQTFSTILTDTGSAAGTGILALASTSNSSIESTLNADIKREGSLISAEQASLTAELNSANEIMQELPSQLEGVNELYSAITGFDQNTNG
jgi:flagellar hook-associated protein 2